MNKDLDAFFRQAKAVRLQPGEKEEILFSVRAASDPCQKGHMTGPLEHMIGSARAVRLTDEERSAISARIDMFVRAHPVAFQTIDLPQRYSWHTISSLFSSFRFMPTLAFALLLVLGGGMTSAAAEAALPGDVLYPVKVHVNEIVKAALASSPEAKAQFQTQLVQRRLAEARDLAVRGSIDADAQQQVAVSIEQQVKRARQNIADLSVQDGAEIAANVNAQLEAAIKSQQKVFTRIAQSRPGSVDIIITALANADAGSTDLQQQLQAKLETGSAEAIQTMVKKGIENAKAQAASMRLLMEKKQKQWTPALQQELSQRLESAEKAIANAQANLEAGAAVAALKMAAEANADAQEAQGLGSVQQLLHVETKTVNGDTSVEVKTNGGQEPKIEVKGNGAVRVNVNGKERAVTSREARQQASSSTANAGSSAATNENSVSVMQHTQNSAGTTQTTTHTEVQSNVNVQGGGLVHIQQSTNANVNVHVGD